MSYGDHITRNRGAIRFLLFALGIPQALIGLWALLAPRSFYDDFPAGTSGWVNVLGPFDEHLVTDVGALFVGLGFLLAFAAVSLRRGTVLAAAIAWLIFAVPHFAWHVVNLEPYGTADAVGNTVTLDLDRRRRPAGALPRARAGGRGDRRPRRGRRPDRRRSRQGRRPDCALELLLQPPRGRPGARADQGLRPPLHDPRRLRGARVRDGEGRPRPARPQEARLDQGRGADGLRVLHRHRLESSPARLASARRSCGRCPTTAPAPSSPTSSGSCSTSPSA